ncbi:MAG: hypothetical protein D6722_17225 [Bacteroidetes bacterium]|nr:MAG: hypothetical protein D6722_17225 [Bacteroidota bacterium]
MSQPGPDPICVTREGSALHVQGQVPAGTRSVEIQLWSTRNASVSSDHQLSPRNPAYDSLSQEPLRTG